MMETWRLIRSGLGSAAYNMALDEAIVIAHSEGKVPPTVRFYGWNPPAMSIGYFQKAEKEINMAEVTRQGFGFVRRPTGGRAVLHDKELTYSIIVSENYPGMPKSVTAAYRLLSEGLLRGFRELGLAASLVQPTEQKAGQGNSAACFDAPSSYELVVEGRKVVGSAQMRQKGVILQHGSILLELNTAQLFALLTFPSDAVKQRLMGSFDRKAVAINTLRRALDLVPATLGEVEMALQKGIADGLNIQLLEEEPSSFELETARELEVDKYATDSWNRRN